MFDVENEAILRELEWSKNISGTVHQNIVASVSFTAIDATITMDGFRS